MGEQNHDLTGYTSKDNTIFYKDRPMARLQAITYSLDGGELVREMNFKLLDRTMQDEVDGLIFFVAKLHEGEEVEVEIDIDENTTQAF
jgi:hypothetical protein